LCPSSRNRRGSLDKTHGPHDFCDPRSAVLALPDVFTKVLGLKLSDRTASDEFGWFCVDDVYHHTIAVFRGKPALHHYAFDFHLHQGPARIADTLLAKDRT
jgi:hypothetical protein